MPEDYQAPDQELLDDEGLPGEDGPEEDYRPGTDEEGGEEKGLAKALKDTKATLTREQQARAELERKLAKAEGAIEQLSSMSPKEKKEKAEAITDFLDDPTFQDRLLDDPANLVTALKRLVSDIGHELGRRDEFIMRSVKQLSPERQQLKEKIEELKNSDEFAGWDEEFLVPVAKKLVEVDKGGEEEEGDEPRLRGIAGGGRRVASKSKRKDPQEAAVEDYMRRLGYDRYDKENK